MPKYGDLPKNEPKKPAPKPESKPQKNTQKILSDRELTGRTPQRDKVVLKLRSVIKDLEKM